MSDSDHHHIVRERARLRVILCSYDFRRGDGQARVNASRVRPPRIWPLGEAAPAVAHPVGGNPVWKGGSAF